MENNRKALLWVCGLTLLLSCSGTKCLAQDGLADGWVLGKARLLFDKHVLLKSRLRSSNGGEFVANGVIQISLGDYPDIHAIALLDYQQACVLKYNKTIRGKYLDKNGLVNERFVQRILSPVIDMINNTANNDCVIEVNRMSSNQSYAVLDFLSQDQFDGVIDGYVIIDSYSDSGVLVKDIMYLEHLKLTMFDDFVWDHVAFREAIRSNSKERLFQMGINGVVTSDEGMFYAYYILDDKEYVRSRVCTSDEIRDRYDKAKTKPTGSVKKLIDQTNEEIARRSIPGAWHLDLGLEAAAYVFCK